MEGAGHVTCLDGGRRSCRWDMWKKWKEGSKRMCIGLNVDAQLS